ncbi:MAG: hypothetical protein ABH834_07555 [Candidatus Altiarchaeota archaeon]
MKDKRFLAGVGLLVASSALGWISLFVGGVSSVSEYSGKSGMPILTLVITNFYFRVWFLSWIPFLAGLFLAGKNGLEASRKLMERLF